MAKLMKTFIGSIGGITSRMTGGDTYEVLTETDRHVQKKDSPIDSRLSLSSEEDSHLHGEEDSFDFEAPKKSGTVNKWTNYLHGWQERFFVVGDGILSYYKSEFDTQYGCRGSISLHKVKILVSPSGRRGVCICPLPSTKQATCKGHDVRSLESAAATSWVNHSVVSTERGSVFFSKDV